MSDSQELMLRWVSSLVLGTAVLVTVLRIFTMTELGYNQTLQIQAAQNLLAGKGLKIFPGCHLFHERRIV